MPWLLDPNHWIVLLKGRCLPLVQRLRTIPPDEVRLCSVVKGELYYGAEGYDDRGGRMAKLESLFTRHVSVPFDDAAAQIAARLRKDLERRRQVIGPHDLQIAAGSFETTGAFRAAAWQAGRLVRLRGHGGLRYEGGGPEG